ncbi:MAG: LytR/AlgR family response regulator transcription factor [Saprospiraceae bacterium]
MKILIIEDELMIARRILRMTRAFYGARLEQITHCDALTDGQQFLSENEIDVLLLDLNLNGEDGFEVLKNMIGYDFHIIIISAYQEKAITAFEYGVLDFVPKPFNEKRLNQAFLRITNKETKQGNGLKYLAIQKKGSQLLLEVKDVIYIKGARIYTELYLKNGTKEIHNKSLNKLEKLLPDSFERIHKSYLVDMNQVSELRTASGGKYSVFLKTGDHLPVSRTKYKELKDRWII